MSNPIPGKNCIGISNADKEDLRAYWAKHKDKQPSIIIDMSHCQQQQNDHVGKLEDFIFPSLENCVSFAKTLPARSDQDHFYVLQGEWDTKPLYFATTRNLDRQEWRIQGKTISFAVVEIYIQHNGEWIRE